MYPREIECGVCQSTVTIQVITSTNSFGSADLDTRPAPMQRFNLGVEISRCPHCGYCRHDITVASEGDVELVKQDKYKSQLNNSSFPETANNYLCQALLDEAADDAENQFWSYLSAAWACDDENNEPGSQSCRLLAADIGKKAIDNQISFGGDRDSEIAILVDILRRAQEFEEAKTYVDNHAGSCENETVQTILSFQKRLIQGGDSSCHTIEEAF